MNSEKLPGKAEHFPVNNHATRCFKAKVLEHNQAIPGLFERRVLAAKEEAVSDDKSWDDQDCFESSWNASRKAGILNHGVRVLSFERLKELLEFF